uniref:Mitochondrial intermembrane space import and assembly protein 40 homolog n=1 Tax=Oryza officinalis TaxID=4535 RepID=D0ABE8_9ORYZ|nr:OO_Ba0013J05-OO_Ba0033A15.5 [Oryza officinalis]
MAINISPAIILMLDSLNAEAMSFDEDGNESIDMKVQKALDCPCVAELKNGPCGSQFVDAFSCFLKSTEEEKGSDCVKPFIALQDCIKINPEAFSKEILEEEENDEEAEKSNLKVRAPAWRSRLGTKEHKGACCLLLAAVVLSALALALYLVYRPRPLRVVATPVDVTIELFSLEPPKLKVAVGVHVVLSNPSNSPYRYGESLGRP